MQVLVVCLCCVAFPRLKTAAGTRYYEVPVYSRDGDAGHFEDRHCTSYGHVDAAEKIRGEPIVAREAHKCPLCPYAKK